MTSKDQKDGSSRKRSTTDVSAELARVVRDRELLDGINRVLREALDCETDEQVAAVCLDVAEQLTESKFGFIGRLNEQGLFDTMAISNPGWDACQMPDATAIQVIKDMPLTGVDRSTMREGKSRVVNEPESHPDHRPVPEGHPPVTCFMGICLQRQEKTIGMIGLANKEGGYDESDQEDIERLSVAFVEAITRKQTERLLAQQAKELLELSTPILKVWDGIIVAPLIGTLDSVRTQRFTERLLEVIVETGAEVALVDITGVPIVDTHTAQHLLETTSAVKLLGARVVLTGIRPAIAQVLVQLGIDLSSIITRSSLLEGLRVAMGLKGLEVTEKTTAVKE